MAMIPNLSDIKEKAPIKEGGEYDLRIFKVKEVKSKRTGRYGCMFIMEIDGEDNAADLFHTLWYGNYKDYQGDDDEKNTLMWGMVKEFIRDIGLDPNEEIEDDELIGVEFSADLSYDDGTVEDEDTGERRKVYQPKNEIARITSN